jgi:hypothetical protein
MTRALLFASLAPLFLLATPSWAARPRLAVLVVFDQLRSVELERYAPFFGDKGFGGLDAARFDSIYSYAATETGPGHATLVTGVNPDMHGIATNTWLENSKRRYVVDDDAFPVLGAGATGGKSPKSLVAPTLGDVMKAESGGKAKVITLSHKDRAAILTGGQSADLAVWYEPTLGRYTTSKAYVDALPPWLDDAGVRLPAATFASARWSPLPIPKGLEHLVPVDDRVGEGATEGVTTTFPHDVSEQPEPLRRKLYRLTPQSMDDLFALAVTAVDTYGLGKDEEPDLLVVSVSTTDIVGHNYGPDSFEQLDALRRADLALRKFVQALEARLLARSFVIAVSSDHGAPPLPATAVTRRGPGAIVRVSDIVEAAERSAAAALPGDKKKRMQGFWAPQLFLDESDLKADDVRKLRDAVARGVAALPGIARVYDLTRPEDDDAHSKLMRASAFRGRSANLFVRQEPRVVFLDNAELRGTDHGTPYMYDRRVPLLVAGPGVRRGRYAQPVDPRDTAATLAFLLQVPPPDMSEGRPVPAVGD